MKKMKTSLAIAIALAAGVGTSAYAQLTKQDTITLALTLQGQSSVSTSATVANAGNFSQGPLYYKTSSSKFTQANLLKAISYVMHGRNASFYTTQATLELVQGELGGFWNIGDSLAQSFPDYDTDDFLIGSFNDDGLDSSNPFYPDLEATFFPNLEYGFDSSDTFDFDTSIPNDISDASTVATTSISLGDDNISYARLDTGRHFLPVPWQSYDVGTETGVPYATTGEYPVGHMQPWGQIYVKDPGHKDSSGNPLCEKVTFFFDLEVQECYDCFYLSSFISDATFKNVAGTQSGPPCCTSPGFITGKGTDHYYLTLEFDNTLNNSYLNPALQTNENDVVTFAYAYVGFTGVAPTFSAGLNPIAAGALDGLSPDLLDYSDSIRSRLGTASQYETRFSLHGLVTYSWTLKLINNSDAAADYIGKATYSANGYGFIALVCDLITGSATFTETAVKDIGCCDDEFWYDDEVNSSFGLESLSTGWYGPGWDGSFGYFNPEFDQYNPYPFYNIVSGQSNDPNITDNDLPDQNESPYNPAAALTRHQLDDGSSSIDNEDNNGVNNYIFRFNND